MFDIGFTELLIVAIVGLLVLGPERLPDAVRTGSKWLKLLNTGFDRIRADVERELGTEELQTQLRNESISKSFEKDREQLEVLDQKTQSRNIEFLDSLVDLEEPSLRPTSSSNSSL